MTKATAPSCEHHVSDGRSKVGPQAMPPSPSWEHSTGLFQLQKLPGGWPGASVTIVLWFSFLLCPLLLLSPLTGAVPVSGPQLTPVFPKGWDWETDMGTKCFASEAGLIRMNFIQETESSHLAFRASSVLLFILCMLSCFRK